MTHAAIPGGKIKIRGGTAKGDDNSGRAGVHALKFGNLKTEWTGNCFLELQVPRRVKNNKRSPYLNSAFLGLLSEH
jgi:hypothetical protein